MAAGTGSWSRPVTAWVGWIWFGALVMMMNGLLNAIDGCVALFERNVYVVTSGHLVAFNFTAWGWILLIIGAAQLIVGFCLLGGAYWARLTAIGLVVLSAISQVTFINANPWWSMIVVGLDLVVLWALVVHGDEEPSLFDI